MELTRYVDWPTDAAEAKELQERLRGLVRLDAAGPLEPVTVAGVDVAYEPGSDRVAAAAVVLDATTLEVVETASVVDRVGFAYTAGLLAFREAPVSLAALQKLSVIPDVIVCDGVGIAHPRRFGLACHVGVLTDLPTVGVAKNPFLGRFDPPGPARGDRSGLYDGGELIGVVLRTRTGVKPVFVSVGHRCDLEDACDLVLSLCRRYRLPETTRAADRLARAALVRAR